MIYGLAEMMFGLMFFALLVALGLLVWSVATEHGSGEDDE